MAYIKKEPIVEFITKGLNNPDKTKAYGYDAIEILTEIEYAPEADVVEVVRCSGCVHWQPLKEDRISKGVCCNEECGNCMSYTRPIDFCGYGERRVQE